MVAETLDRPFGGQREGAARLPPRARRPWLKRLFRRRDAVTVSHRCLAIHLYLAAPHSAMERE